MALGSRVCSPLASVLDIISSFSKVHEGLGNQKGTEASASTPRNFVAPPSQPRFVAVAQFSGFSAFRESSILELLNDFCRYPQWCHLVGMLTVHVAVSDGDSDIEVYLRLKDGDSVPRQIFDGLKLAPVQRTLRRKIRSCFDMDAAQAHAHLAYFEPPPPKTGKAKESKAGKRRRDRKSRRLFKEFYSYQSGSSSPWDSDSDCDSFASSFDDVDMSEKVRYFRRFWRARPRVESAMRAYISSQNSLTELLTGVSLSAFEFIKSLQLAKAMRFDRTQLRAFLTLRALDFVRCVLDKSFTFQVIDTMVSHLWAMMSHLSHDVLYVEQSFVPGSLDLFTKFGMFFLVYPFMRASASWGERKTWFENATTHFYKRGGVSDQTDFVTSMLDFFSWIAKTGTQCFTERSLSPIWQTAESYAQWYDLSLEIIREETSVGLGIDVADYMQKLETAIENGERVLHVARTSNSPATPAVTKVLSSLKDILYSEKLFTLARENKPVPFFMGIFGAPKTGKTYLIDELLHYYFAHKGEAFEERFKYVKSSTDAFDSGLKTYHKAMIVDDVGTLNEKVASNEAISGPRFIMEVANSTIAASNQADLKDKGRIFARPEIVLVTSNAPDFGAKGILKHPAAYLRRIRFRVSLSLKEEFRKGDSNFIDTDKVIAAGTRDIHLFNIVEFVIAPKGEGEPIKEINGTVLDYENVNYHIVEKLIHKDLTQNEFFAWFADEIDSHEQLSRFTKNNSKELSAAKICERCGLFDFRCSCPEIHEGPLPCFYEDQGLRSWFRAKFAQKAAKLGYRQLIRSLGASGVSWGMIGKSIFQATKYKVSTPLFQRTLVRVFAIFLNFRLIQELSPAVKPPLPNSSGSSTNVHVTKVMNQVETYDQWVTRLKAEGVTAPLDVYHNTERVPPLSLKNRSSSMELSHLLTKVRKNMVDIGIKDGGHVAGTGLYDDVILTVAHVMPKQFPARIMVVREGVVVEGFIHHSDIVRFDRENDICLFRFRKMQFKSLMDFIPVCMNYMPTLDHATLLHPEEKWCREDVTFYPSLATSASGRLHPKFEADFFLGNGACGALIVGVTSRKRPFIAGMHHLGAVTTQSSLLVPLNLDILKGGIHEARARIFKELNLELQFNGLKQTKDRAFEKGSYHFKSYVHYREPTKVCEPIGSIDYPLLFPKTRITPTPLHGLIQPSLKVIPDMRIGTFDGVYQNPFNNVVDSLHDSRATYPQHLLQKATDQLVVRWKRIFEHASPAHPLDEKTSLNGLAGVRFIDPFKRKTGRGLPLRGPKSSIIMDDGKVRFYTPEARESVRFTAHALSEHTNPGIIADINLKDEVKKPGKDIRGFAAMPFTYNDLMRRLSLPVFKVIQENSILSGIAIGMDADSSEWKVLYQKHMGRKFHVLYDFKQFDRSHSKEILRAAHSILFEMMCCIYPKDATVEGIPWYQVAAGGLALASTPLYNVQGTIYQCQGSLASGMFHTAVVNSICQELILQMIWYEFVDSPAFTGDKNHPDSFKRYNVNTMYGDDGFVSSDVEGFDLPFFAATAAKWNLTITDPLKTDPNRKSFPLETWSFLKRGFVPRVDDLGFYVEAPLEFQSVVKTMNYWEAPSDVPEVDAMVDRLNQAALYLCSMRSVEATQFHAACRGHLMDLYGPQIADSIWSLEKAFSIKAGKLVELPSGNMSNFADCAFEHRASFESRWYDRPFVLIDDETN